MLTSRTRSMLLHAGHSAREFSPSTTRVVGTLPGMRPHPNPNHEQLRYMLPAIELRRLLAESRALDESFSLTYRRISKTGAAFTNRTVKLVETQLADGRRVSHCRASTGRHTAVLSKACAADEIALLPPSDWWLTGMLLAFPLPMRAGGEREMGCLA